MDELEQMLAGRKDEVIWRCDHRCAVARQKLVTSIECASEGKTESNIVAFNLHDIRLDD